MQEGEKTVVKGLSFCGVTEDGNSVQVDVKDGKIIRIRPFHFDWKYEREPWTIEARGKTFESSMKSLIPPFTLAYKNRINSPNRVMYPLKRVDWDPDGERNTEKRGESRYERITWDEATDIIASELKRVQKKYGPTSVLLQGDGHGETKTVHAAHGCPRKLLRLAGGYTFQVRNPDSWEGWYWGAKHVWGWEPVGKQADQRNMVPEIANNSGMLFFWGCDPESTPWGWGGQTVSQLCYWFTELGIKQVYVCPDVNYGTAVHADKWIPIKPGTTSALQLAIAHVWMTEGSYDKEYVATHVVGFDKFEDYVLGREDGTPKEPVWASGITGIPSRTIKALARAWASTATSLVHGNGGNMVRGPYAHESARLEVCLLGMQGLGKPGCNVWSTIEWGLFGQWNDPPKWDFGKTICVPRHALYPDLAPTNRGGFDEPGYPDQIIPKPLIHKAILDPPLKWYGCSSSNFPVEDQFKQYKYPNDGCSEIHMIWTDSPSLMTCWNDSNYLSEAFRSPKIEFIVAQHPWIENDCEYADIILPVVTKFEVDDIGVDNYTAEFGTLYLDPKCVEPKGESRSDYEAVCAVAEKMGLLEEYTEGKSVDEWIKNGYETCGVKDMVSWEEFKEKGHFVIPNDQEPETKDVVGMRKFYEDPENNPLRTPSGKLEFYSQRLADNFPDDMERRPLPGWVEKGIYHDERLSSKRAKKYPFLTLSNHPRWRVHSQHDDMQWLREMETNKIIGPDGYAYQTMWLHPDDAEKKGIKHRDIVNIFNERGGVLAGAYVTERTMPGIVYIDHGARYDPIVPGKLDRGGAINTITPRNTTSKNATGMVSGEFLVDVERVNLEELRRKYPEAFNRPYDQASGLCYERMLAKK
ncbi:MAG: molybdopterin-dependent oxidoreductase [Deltaproteobacteria bacterium]|nr:molybdopterin-dependent oxidoreductase [Deltaproteobacteria bacterium]